MNTLLDCRAVTVEEQAHIDGYPNNGLYVLAVRGGRIDGGERVLPGEESVALSVAISLQKYFPRDAQIYSAMIQGGILSDIREIRLSK